METWRAGAGWTAATWPAAPGAADTTSWTYVGTFENPSAKTYAPAAAEATRRTVRYRYHRNGSLMSREWQRTPRLVNPRLPGFSALHVASFASAALFTLIAFLSSSQSRHFLLRDDLNEG